MENKEAGGILIVINVAAGRVLPVKRHPKGSLSIYIKGQIEKFLDIFN
jgi:hypothetical protein